MQRNIIARHKAEDKQCAAKIVTKDDLVRVRIGEDI